MIKNNKQTLLLTSIVILLPILVGMILWDRLPDQVVTHWDANGTPNGWSSKVFAVFGLPLSLLALHWICTTVTSADPKIKTLNKKLVTIILWICPLISLFSAITTYAEALDLNLQINLLVTIFVGTVFVIIGNYLPKCEQNYTVGIKLPWTLNSKENWNRTHRIAGPVWVVCGVLMILSIFMDSKVVIILILVLTAVLIPTLYSYLYYKKQEQKQ